MEYSLKCCVGTTAEMKAEKDMESKIYFVVYENPPDDVALPVASDKRPWKSCGCIDKGFVSITASLSKACYQAGEKIATATLEVDNISIYIEAPNRGFCYTQSAPQHEGGGAYSNQRICHKIGNI